MLFSKYTVDFFLFYFYVIYESFLQIPGLEEGFLRYSELVYRYSSATQVWDAYVSYWVQAPKIIYELPQSGCTWLTSILYANPVKLTNNLSRGFFMLRTYRVYVLVENSMVFFIRQILLNCTPGILFYPIVDIGFW